LQLGAGPPTQTPPLQVSSVVQALPSLQGFVLLVCAHPVVGLHESVVQGLPSSQLGAGPPTQLPPLQVSLVVQASLSLQGSVLLTCTQPVAGLQESSVQGLTSLQLGGGPPTQLPPLQVSLVVQALPSSHGSVLSVCVQPVAGLQLSVVHTLPSSQFRAAPPTQTPPLQVSLVVQALPSLHDTVLFVCVQPVAGLQPSVVHTLPSSQFGAAPPTQTPPLQVSLVVQALPSLHGAVLFECVQTPPLHTSSVQTLPSVAHGAVLFVWVQPETVQTSSVQPLPSLQFALFRAYVTVSAGRLAAVAFSLDA